MLSKFNIKIIYRPGLQNVKVDALTRISGSVPTDPANKHLKQQHQVLLTPNWLELDGAKVAEIDKPIFYQIAKANKDDELYHEIRTALVDGLTKYKDISLDKYSVHNGVLYYLDRLWVPESIYTKIIRETYDQPAYGHLGVTRTYLLLRREYY